jgi:uncharacterized membrane protein
MQTRICATLARCSITVTITVTITIIAITIIAITIIAVTIIAITIIAITIIVAASRDTYQAHTSATRITRLERAPEILICHLKRFRHDGMMGQVRLILSVT